MSLNKVKGDMYPWVDFTWNTVKGECPHGCDYCYMKKWGPQPELHFDEKELKTDLGSGNFIFVGSSCDMWAETIFPIWIFDTLDHCKKYDNKYLFQSKNPDRIYRMRNQLPPNVVIGTTIETNRSYAEMGSAPGILDRAWNILQFSLLNIDIFITIEPILNFDLNTLVGIIKAAEPDFVNIGSSTTILKTPLPEPSPEKVRDLIEALKEFTEVKVKSNLRRLML